MSDRRIRICPACGTKNKLDAWECKSCGVDITNVPPVDEKDDRNKGTSSDKLIRACPNPKCGYENPSCEIRCSKCGENIDTIEPHPPAQSNPSDSSSEFLQSATAPIHHPQSAETTLECLQLSCHDGTIISCGNDEIIGREGTVMVEYFDRFTTISRKHARIILKAGKWHVIDLNSANGTFLNEARLTPMTEYPLKENDHLRFSSKMEVVIRNLVGI